MFSAFSVGSYQLWRPRRNTPRVHEENQLHAQTQSLHRHLHLSEQEHHFAPPLAAYLADQCGPDDAATEYNAAVEQALLSGATDVALLLPTTLRRLDALRRIRATGYTTLVPIGVGATMAEMDREAEADLLEVQVENLEVPRPPGAEEDEGNHHTSGNDTGVEGNRTHHSEMHEGNSVLDANVGNMDADLDDDVFDADADTFHSSGGSTPDGFMAEDVEYQDDHSLGVESAYEPVTAELELSSRFQSTAPTAVSTARRCDDSDVDMTFD